LQVLSDEWRTANTRIVELERSEAGIANNPTITAVPDHLKDRAEQVKNAIPFKKSFQVVPVTIGMIDLDQLVVFQKHINTTYAAELKARLGATPSEEEIFELCLPLGDHQP